MQRIGRVLVQQFNRHALFMSGNNHALPELTPNLHDVRAKQIVSITEPIGIANDVRSNGGNVPISDHGLLFDEMFMEERCTFGVGKEAITSTWTKTSKYTADIRPMMKRQTKSTTSEMACEEYSQEELTWPTAILIRILEGDDKLPVIIAKDLKDEEKAALLKKRTIEPSVAKSKTGKPKNPRCDQKGVENKSLTLDCYPISDNRCPWVSPDTTVYLKKRYGELSSQMMRMTDPTLRLDHGMATISAIGAVLGKEKNQHFQPIHYASKDYGTEAQTHITTTEKEFPAVVYAFEKLSVIFLYVKKHMYTDNTSAIQVSLRPRKMLRQDHAVDLIAQEFLILKFETKKELRTRRRSLSRLENPHQDKTHTKKS
ncbi:reverse transcriptase domain-containing protein [Tanacetum coccineum]